MSKILLQDMVKRKTIKEVKISKPVSVPVQVPEPIKVPEQIKIPEHKHHDIETKFASIYDIDGEKNENKSRYGLWFVAFISAAFLFFALSFLFSAAKITVNPRVKDVASNVNLLAVKDGSTEGLPFDVVVISGEENKTVPAGVERDVSLKAKGKVVIYNAFGSASQPLAIDTRLEGSNGKIYKTETKITVPGMKGSIPGSVEVGIYGAEAGEEYNSTPLDFKIFGFKGTPKYSKFYARSKGDIAGGLKGKSSDISDAEKIKTISELEITLKDKLFKKAADQIPSGFILFKDAVILNKGEEDVTFTPKDNMIMVNMKGSLLGFLFEEKKLAQKVVEKILPNEDGALVYISNIRNLVFSFINRENLSADVKNIDFNLTGNAAMVWRVDENKITDDLLGERKSNLNQILSTYPNIISAQLVMRPFWKMSFPGKAKDIQVIVNYPK